MKMILKQCWACRSSSKLKPAVFQYHSVPYSSHTRETKCQSFVQFHPPSKCCCHLRTFVLYQLSGDLTRRYAACVHDVHLHNTGKTNVECHTILVWRGRIWIGHYYLASWKLPFNWYVACEMRPNSMMSGVGIVGVQLEPLLLYFRKYLETVSTPSFAITLPFQPPLGVLSYDAV